MKSLFHPRNLTFRKKLKNYYRNFEFRVAYLMSILNNNRAAIHPDMMRFFVYHYHISCLVALCIGIPPVGNLLILDTGSGLTWIQCQPCKSCYNQSYPVFDPRNQEILLLPSFLYAFFTKRQWRMRI